MAAFDAVSGTQVWRYQGKGTFNSFAPTAGDNTVWVKADWLALLPWRGQCGRQFIYIMFDNIRACQHGGAPAGSCGYPGHGNHLDNT